MIHWSNFRKSMTDHDPFSKKVFLARDFGKVWKTKIEFHKSIQKSISKIRGGKHPCKKPSQSIGQQRIQPAKKPSKVLQKIDSNFKTTTPKMGRAPEARSLLFSNLYRFFVGLGLAFWPSFFGWIFAPDFLR